jgi:DNA polymerase bacteriophage-type
MTLPKIHLDFETRSACDLKKAGTHVYSTHPTTSPWCMAYAFDDGPVSLWAPGRKMDKAADFAEQKGVVRLFEAIRAGATVTCHNAYFEWNIWNNVMAARHGWPELRHEQMRCTMAMAYALALPGSLENAAAAVGLKMAKDMDGHKLMMQMARPRRVEEDGAAIWWDDEARKQRLYAYCRQDVEVERELEKRLLQLMPSEQELWILDQRINDRGIMVDLPAIDAALALVESEKARLDKEIARLTDGQVRTCNQVMEITDWIKGQGVDVDGLAKADVTELLSYDALPDNVRAVLKCRQEAAKSSTAKLKAMKEAASADGRVRGCFQYHAATTGRWGGRKIQPQNFPRGVIGLTDDDIENVFNVLGG